MTLPIVVRPEARSDVTEACEWYDGKSSGLGQRFLDELDRMFQRIQSHPLLYEEAMKNVRRARLRRFPYVIYYRVLAERIEVLAVLHGRRDPRVWQRRM